MLTVRDQRGAAPVEVTFAIVLLMLLTLGVIQVALALYARNVVASSAHEGARAAIERGRTVSEAAAIARDVVTGSTGRLVEDLDIDLGTRTIAGRRIVTVRVVGTLAEIGPIPFPFPLSATATVQTDEELR